ncbi:integrin beta-PS isoform X1 [Anopheles ziemanni]|uniref:integrin beta-PS isoform X1 n=1 Tax=Anopheles coustani TaxID=139045 RepID=UPI00265B19A7|nr:integrin beta-PS isoform X1 [Anopheles coustani]XP_058176533.1 integrin beta-PS isoform X1 [Anopheles ziemanni]
MIGSSTALATMVMLVALALLALTVDSSAGQVASYQLTTCPGKTTCSQCIQTTNCRWCKKPNFTQPRCHGQIEKYCPEEYTVDPSNEFRLLLGRELTKATKRVGALDGQSERESYYSSSHYQSSSSSHSFQQSSSSSSYESESAAGSIVQISPQSVSLKLRLNEVYRLNVNYAQAEDYPVDLYYLMDLSKSMEDDKTILSTLGAHLASEMRKITNNFKLGFGSFVDKVLMPYVSTVPKKLEHPCEGCNAPYGYLHHMSLSSDSNLFTQEVQRANVSGNLDAPEGGFDAIMQAIVCREQIGWREKARRLLLFSTDAGFHYAGDGKLGGVITPNDGDCHLDHNGRYTHSTTQDYPSISQINLKVKQNAINVIFAVTQEELSVYEKLSRLVEGSSAAKLSNDSSNIVDLVRDQYDKISSSVEMKDNRTDNVIDVKYYSRCRNTSSQLQQTNRCEGLKVGDVVTFEAHITLLQCPSDPRDWHQVLQIYPVGINESLTVNIEMLCSCDCEQPADPEYREKASECSNAGTYKCGICECDGNYHGQHCECSATDSLLEPGMVDACRMSNSSDECSGRGQCVCGVCVCERRPNPDEVIEGRYCECDNFSCDRPGGLLCSGPDHGRCVCGQCECRDGWTGPACDCRASNETCMPPDGGELCSGHGECECGTCRCSVDADGRYTGRYCEKCPTCSGRCNEFKHCVQCQQYQTGPLANADDCATNCTLFVPVPVEKVVIDEQRNDNKCTFYDEDDCRFEFSYNDSDQDKVVVMAQEQRECPPKVFMLGIALAVIAAVVLIGMAVLLLWKVLTSIHDRREFARFEKERMMAKWDTGENPIYKQATTTFKNPTYAGK